jgi:hypothetical protein
MRADLENLSARSLWVLSTIHKYLVEHEHLLAVKVEHVFGAVQSMEAVSDITPIVKKLVEGAYLQAEKGGLVFTLKGLIAVGATPSREPPSFVSVEFLLLIALADRFTRLLEEGYDVLFIQPLTVALELGLTHSSAWVEKAIKNYEADKLLVTSVGKDSSDVPITLVSLTGIALHLAGIRKRQLLDGRLDFDTQASPRDEDATLTIAATDDGRRTGSITSDRGREGGVQLGIDPTMPQGDPETIPNVSVLSAGTTPTFVSSDLDPGSSVKEVSIPAADRIVRLDDNAPGRREAIENLERIETALESGSNELKLTADERVVILSETRTLRQRLADGRVRLGALFQAIAPHGFLLLIINKLAEDAIGLAANIVLSAIKTLLQVFL